MPSVQILNLTGGINGYTIHYYQVLAFLLGALYSYYPLLVMHGFIKIIYAFRYPIPLIINKIVSVLLDNRERLLLSCSTKRLLFDPFRELENIHQYLKLLLSLLVRFFNYYKNCFCR